MIKLGLYQHNKGMYYQVIGVARHEETHKPLVIYQSLYGDYALWARDLNLFQATVTINGKEVPRFKFIRENLANMPELK